MGLPAFKVRGFMGGEPDVSCHLGYDEAAASLDQLREWLAGGPAVSLVTATDGNRGRAIGRLAVLLGLLRRGSMCLPA